MARGIRPDRVGEEIRQELAVLLSREVHDPGVGFVTITRVKVSPDLQLARAYYTTMGDERARRETARALDRATPFLRRHLGDRVRLRRVPELRFELDRGVEHQDRIERVLLDLEAERQARGPIDEAPAGDTPAASHPDQPASPSAADAAPRTDESDGDA
ncbi:MAG TPA: 30S ribosome-binding factor RbfA [Vicinamibacterales bacterium]|jgi:ribosome-binding factor A|nr:30S ribosome-binding factor RbfA [Vicinamibacterales bacterium]